MNTPEWLKPGVVGAVIGAIVVGIVGFTWGGWVTESTASAMAQDEVRLAMVPVCVEMSRLDPDREAKLASIKSASTYQRRTAVMETGWATMPGADAPDRDLATACIEGLDLDAS